MADFRFDDLVAIVLALLWLALFVFGSVILYALVYNYGRYLPTIMGMIVGRYGSIRIQGRDIIKSRAPATIEQDFDDFADDMPGETNNETGETPHIDAETRDELIYFGENRAIARLIVSETIKLTEGVKNGTGKRSGPAYQKRSKEIQELVEQMKKENGPQFRTLDEKKQPVLN